MPKKTRPEKNFESRAGTAAVWAGETEEGFERATQTPVVHSVAYAYENLDEWTAVLAGEAEGHIYGRNSSPTVAVFEEKVRHLEAAESATSTATGMAAISNTFFALLSPGQRMVSQKDSYGGTSKLFLDFLPRFGVEVVMCDTTDFEEFEREIEKGCDLLYLETPTNPTLKVLDIARLSKAAKTKNAPVVVDNTIATPINQNPLTLGADLVIHSATKFLGGHSDAMGGIVCGRSDLVEQVFQFREINGASLGPMAAYLLIRGLKTLELRVQRQNASALALARFLQSQEGVDEVFYPGLETHPGHETAVSQMRGFGGVLSFSLQGGEQVVGAFLEKLRFAHLAAHLGGVETVVGPPKTTSHCETTAEERALLGIPENLVRYSVGIEDLEDLQEDLSAALDSL
ncbi:MAG: cystathionine gamma-synthase family protein [Bacteroidetes bacterium]|nr:cystathionine gamma-synthase family protein [Bacteroidota bacterium]